RGGAHLGPADEARRRVGRRQGDAARALIEGGGLARRAVGRPVRVALRAPPCQDLAGRCVQARALVLLQGRVRPLRLQRPPRVPPLEEYRREAARGMLQVFIGERLVPLGCLRAAIDDAGKLCVARTPRLDAYFGRKVAAADLAGVAGGESKVVVQPDFSVVVI